MKDKNKKVWTCVSMRWWRSWREAVELQPGRRKTEVFLNDINDEKE